MGNRFSRQEEIRVQRMLVLENIRRVLFSALACIVVVPVFMLVSRFSTAAASFGAINKVLILFEVFALVSCVVAYMQLKNRDTVTGKGFYRVFWMLFEMFSFTIIYSNAVAGGRTTFYPLMLAAMLLVPITSLTELMYYMVLQGVFMTFMCVKFGVIGSDIVNLLLLNAFFISFSRILGRSVTEKLMLQERARDNKDSELRDKTTGLLNRKGLEKAVVSSIDSCIKTRRRISILMIDIDDMKAYNEQFGSEKGNSVIKEVAGYIKQVVMRNTDVVSRLDGGRFLVYMEAGDDMEPLKLAEKVRQVILDRRITHGRRASYPFITVSIGVASCLPKSERDFSEIYDEAEDNLLEAKEHGKNITIYDAQIYGDKKKVSGLH